MKVDKNKTPFFITLAAPSIPLNVGPFLITLSVEPNIVFCAYAELSASIYNSTFLQKKFVKEFGLHFNKDDSNDRYFHPKEGKEAAEKDEETVLVGEGFDNLKFGIQTVLSCPVTATLQNTISLSVGPTFEPTFEVKFPLKGKKKDLYQIEDKYLYENEGYESSFSMPFSITAKGTIGFKKWMSADLFTLTIKLPSVTPIVSDLIDSYSISSIKEDKEKTTYSEVAYRAKIKSDFGIDMLYSPDLLAAEAMFDMIDCHEHLRSHRFKRNPRIMLMGASKIGIHLARLLSELSCSVKLIELDKERAYDVSADLNGAVDVIYGDGTEKNLLFEEGIHEADAFVALTGIDEENLLMSVFAQSHNVPRVIAKVDRNVFSRLGSVLGVTELVSPMIVSAEAVRAFIFDQEH